ncbi:hypothetical protein [Serratia bockelmannii]|uniref:hypothetical protein n=1 Tax=Serratia bockelmannii TaxID=2703793 RepID=UPI00301BB3BB
MTLTTEQYTEGLCGDGAAILCDGVPMSVSEILAALNAAYREAQPVALVDRRPAASGSICWQNGGKDLPHGTELFTAPPAPAIPDIGSSMVNDAAWKLHDTLTEHGPLNGHQFNNLKGCLYEALKIVMTATPAPAVPDDYFGELVKKARSAADKAMRKFPQPNYVLNKVAEESGEVIKAVIHYTEGREEWANVEGEIIDNLAMLIRLVAEGDQVIGFTPPDTCRAAMLAQPVSGGYKLVPVEPTENMIIDGFESDAFMALADAVNEKKGWPYGCRESAECVEGIFKAMLAAAPTQGKNNE